MFFSVSTKWKWLISHRSNLSITSCLNVSHSSFIHADVSHVPIAWNLIGKISSDMEGEFWVIKKNDLAIRLPHLHQRALWCLPPFVELGGHHHIQSISLHQQPVLDSQKENIGWIVLCLIWIEWELTILLFYPCNIVPRVSAPPLVGQYSNQVINSS